MQTASPATMREPRDPLQEIVRLATASIGAVHIGIAVDAVLHAAPASAAHPLPRRRGGQCGVIEHCGSLIPVIDLKRWVDLGVAAGEGSAARILVLRHGPRRIALLVDAVHGLAEAAAADMQRLHHDDDPEEVFHTVVKTRDSDAVLSMLDVSRLAALANAWHDDKAAPAMAGCGDEAAAQPDAGPAHVLPAPATPPVLYGVLEAGGVRLGVPVADLAEVLPLPREQQSAAGLACCQWRGRHVPILPADELIPAGGAPAVLLAIVEHGGVALGVPVRAALGMFPFVAGHGTPSAANDALTTSYDAEGNAVLLLDSARLLAQYPQAALSMARMDGAAVARRTGLDEQRPNPTAHIVFEAGGTFSTPIEVIEQVLPLAPDNSHDQGLASMQWQGRAIAMVDLRGTTAAPGRSGQVLVVRRGDERLACIVTHVHLLVPARSGLLYRIGTGSRAVDFITIGEGTQQASYRIADFAQIARSMQIDH